MLDEEGLLPTKEQFAEKKNKRLMKKDLPGDANTFSPKKNEKSLSLSKKTRTFNSNQETTFNNEDELIRGACNDKHLALRLLDYNAPESA